MNNALQQLRARFPRPLTSTGRGPIAETTRALLTLRERVADSRKEVDLTGLCELPPGSPRRAGD
jgi:hypothetical protein